MNLIRGTEIGRALLKRCRVCGIYVQGRAETLHEARAALRNAMERHGEDDHPIRRGTWAKALRLFLAPAERGVGWVLRT